MAEGRAGNGYAQFIGVGPVQLHGLPGLPHLREMHLAGWPVLGAPLADAALEGAQGVARGQRRIIAQQMLEQRLRLQLRAGLQPRFGLKPEGGQVIGAASPGVSLLELLGSGLSFEVTGGGLPVHAGF